jgi:hypothetical protein
MCRMSVGFVVVAVLGLLSPGAARAGDSAADAKRAAEVRKKMEAVGKFSGIEDPETKLEDALDFLGKTYAITFEINDQAFKDEMIDDVANKALGRAIPKMADASAETVLRRVLARIPAPSGATFAVRGGVVEITTRRYASPSNWRARLEPSEADVAAPPPVNVPETTVNFDKRELQEALQEIADATGVNVVLDARAKDKGKTPITATLRGVAVDTAVKVIADMADLTVVPLDTVLYVTTKENAKALHGEGEKRAAKAEEPKGEGPGPMKPEAGPLQKESERLLKEREEQVRKLKEAFEKKPAPQPEPK